MMQEPILLPAMSEAMSAVGAWLARATQARRISLMLSTKDAALLLAFAEECEAEAMRLARARVPLGHAA